MLLRASLVARSRAGLATFPRTICLRHGNVGADQHGIRQIGIRQVGSATGAAVRAVASRYAATAALRAGPPLASAHGRRTLLRAAAAAATSSAGLMFGTWYYQSLYRLRLGSDDDIELPAVPEPPAKFEHPYENWAWYQRAWFAVKRSVFLAWVFAPFMFASTAIFVFPDSATWREYWLAQMLECTQRAGAAFQKFGQWLSMRPDMFAPDVIGVLSSLRSDAATHPHEVTRNALQEQFGRTVEEIFDEFGEEPVASGSVAQVYRARLRPEFALDGPGGRLRDVAVKVRHPGVADSAFMDLSILWRVIEISEKFLSMTLPFNRGEFDENIQAQMDFTREAHNLQRFGRNFRGERRIRFPKVAPQLTSSEVLVETWAEGRVMTDILEDFDNSEKKPSEVDRKKREIQRKLCSRLYDMNMKMMVRDNFLHADLHGGNILYSEKDDVITVIDAGMATSLDQKTVAAFGKFLYALASRQTDSIVELIQSFNESTIAVNVGKFRQDIQAAVENQDPSGPFNAVEMFGQVMHSMHRHGMLLKGDVASTIFTMSISEGLVRQLDPAFDVARGAVPYLATYMPPSFLSSSVE